MFEKFRRKLTVKSTKPDRKIFVNIELPESELGIGGNPKVSYPDNSVNTAKYNLINFIPKNLFEQFRRVANVYFLVTALIQFIPSLGNGHPVVALIPIIFILGVTAIKDAFEDFRRHQADAQLNKSISWTMSNWKNVNYSEGNLSWWRSIFFCFGPAKPANTRVVKKTHICHCIKPREAGDTCLNCGLKLKKQLFDLKKKFKRKEKRRISGVSLKVDMNGWIQTLWKDIKVGDFVILRGNDNVPADMLILATSEPGGLCYVETKNLDGETNLKARECLKETMHIRNSQDCKNMKFSVKVDSPDANLYAHHGSVNICHDGEFEDNQAIPFSIQNMVLRGSVIRNSEYVIGLVLFTGSDTKVLMNSGKTPSKQSKIEVLMNPLIILNFGVLFIMCSVNALVQGLNTASWSTLKPPYAPQYNNPWAAAFWTFWASFILYQNIVPISLYITIEGIKTLQAYFINNDVKIYDPETDRRCVPKTWNISDDLGQIEYIFSDKTGTLTQNKMEFRKCTINGISYGQGYTDVSRSDTTDGLTPSEKLYQEQKIEQKMRRKLDILSENPYMSRVPLTFVDEQIVDDLVSDTNQSLAIQNFFTLLACCHTVLPPKDFDLKSGKEMIYNAQSPDEQALVKTAKDMGFTFVERLQDEMILNFLGERKVCRILNIIEFNSTRKRMSIIARLESGKIMLFCKGADNIIFERLASNQDELKAQTLVHLEAYANQGLRTLCLAQRVINEEEYSKWSSLYQAAGLSSDRDNELAKVAELIEKDLVLLGATAIEDKLQDQVPECIATLRKAGLKIWVLTGDKMETAINIGFASNLLSKDMQLICLSGSDTTSIHNQIKKFVHGEKTEFTLNSSMKQALIVDGQTLGLILDKDQELKMDFLKLGASCHSVICCRVSPRQKAQVVNLVKDGLKVMCLSIGDGANDVAMIQAANVGVGISGLEGLQAAMSSDYVISQFKFLSRLLLVHGHWSYYRIAETVFTFLYKDMVWVTILFWYQFYCGFTADLLFDITFILFYNLVFTSMPPFVLGIFDQNVDQQDLEQHPELYAVGLKQTLFTYKRFAVYVLNAFYQAAVCFYMGYFLYWSSTADNGRDSDKEMIGTAIGVFCIVVVNSSLGLKIKNWTWLVFVIIGFSITAVLFYIPLWSRITKSELSGLDLKLYTSIKFWLCLISGTFLSLFPQILYGYIKATFYPSDLDLLNERRKYNLGPVPEQDDDDWQIMEKPKQMTEKKPRPTSLPLANSRKPTILNLKRQTLEPLHGFAFAYDDGKTSDLGIQVATGVKTTWSRDYGSSSEVETLGTPKIRKKPLSDIYSDYYFASE